MDRRFIIATQREKADEARTNAVRRRLLFRPLAIADGGALTKAAGFDQCLLGCGEPGKILERSPEGFLRLGGRARSGGWLGHTASL